MKLKPRLSAVAGLVPPGTVVADIGTDHARLPVYLVSRGLNPRVIAIEKSKGSLEKARELLKLFNLEPKVELRLGDGLKALARSDAVETVVIAGLGGRTVTRILGESKELLHGIKYLVLQPMGDDYLLRRWLTAQKLVLFAERLAYENGHYYKVIQAVPGRPGYTDPLLMEIGPRLVEDKDPLLVPYLREQLARYREVLDRIEKGETPRSRRRASYYREKIERLKEVLAFAGENSAGNRYNGRTGPPIPGPGE